MNIQNNLNSLIQWEVLEFEPREVSQNFYIWSGAVFIIIIAYALYTNSPIMAITFILIGIMSYINLEKDPELLHCAITNKGIIIDSSVYDFHNIQSFWITYEPNEQMLTLKTNGSLASYTHIPLGNTNPIEIRDILIKHLPEEEYEPHIIDTIEKMMHIR